MRDIEGLREHFRRQVDREGRDGRMGLRDTADISLVTRRDFFALVKLLREMLLALARLRRAVNEVHLNPSNAATILHEQLDASMDYAPKGSWITRILTGALSSSDTPSSSPQTPAPGVPQESAFTRILGSTPSTPTQPAPLPGGRRARALPIHMVPRASAAKPTSIAVQACGSQVPTSGSHFPQSGLHGFPTRSSALARSSRPRDAPEFARPMRIPEEDPMRLRYGDVYDPTRSLRPRTRGLSDSSIHSTYLEHGERDAPVDRVITAESLAVAPEM